MGCQILKTLIFKGLRWVGVVLKKMTHSLGVVLVKVIGNLSFDLYPGSK